MKTLGTTFLLLCILAAGGNCFGLRSAPAIGQSESTVTDQEKAQVKKFAQQFVEKFMKTRDVAPLIPEFFLSDFTAVAKQDFYEKVSPELYAKLSKAEKVRLFVAQENLGYLITLDVMTQPNSVSAGAVPFIQILPAAIARRLSRSRLLEGTSHFTSRTTLLKELVALEKSLRAAKPFLKRRNLEQSPDFLKKLSKFEHDPHLGYRVRSSVIDEDTKRQLGSERFAIGQKVFSVDTPILIALLVVNDGGRLRILTIIPADDD